MADAPPFRDFVVLLDVEYSYFHRVDPVLSVTV